ncbi:MAG: substrate-binding domain-containing protein [Haloferacaceae archaeon]
MVAEDTRFSDRRTFLKTSGSLAAAGLLAGCSGNGGSGSDGSSGGSSGGSGGDGSSGGSSGGSGGSTDTTTEEMSFPEKPLRFVVPYGPGGGYDFYTRTVARVLQEEDLVPVQTKVENIEGAGGITACNQVYNAEPDGYTNMIVNTESFSVAQLSRPKAVQYDLEKMTAYPRVAGTTPSLAVSKDSGITSGDEFITAVENGEVKFANEGPTSIAAVMMKSLAALGGVDLSIEEYKKNAVTFHSKSEWFTSIKRGDVDMMGGSFSSLRKYVETDELRYVLVFTQEDSCPSGPNVDGCNTLKTASAGLDNQKDMINIVGGPYHRIFAGPPDVPDERHQYLCEKITEAIKHPKFKEYAEKADRPIRYGDCDLANEGLDGTLQTYRNKKDTLEMLGLL